MLFVEWSVSVECTSVAHRWCNDDTVVVTMVETGVFIDTLCED